MAINFDFLNKFLFSGHLDYPFKSYGPKQVRLISTHPWAGDDNDDYDNANDDATGNASLWFRSIRINW